MVGGRAQPSSAADRIAGVERRLDDFRRLRLPLRIAVRQTEDGLGIAIPPQRNIFLLGFMLLWLVGWAAGARFGLREVASLSMPGILMIVWLVPWTGAGLFALWVIGWQAAGRETLFFTAGALVREWRLLGLGGRRVVMADDIVAVKVDRAENDIAGLGTVRIDTTGRKMRIGSGLGLHESELVADLIREQAAR